MRDFHVPGRSPVLAMNGMCATSHPLAAKVALDLLQAGGNAADAAIGAGVLLGICEPQMTGIGGDMFALIKPAGSEDVIALNGSGRAPAGFDPAALRARHGDRLDLRSADAVTVPGAIDAFCALSGRMGRLDLAEVLAPAIRYAEDGVPVAPRVAFDWAQDAPTLQGVARDYYLVSGAVPQAGQVFRAPGQAKVLRRIAAEGRAAFYEGEIAAEMVAALRAAGGCHTEADFAATEATWGAPVVGHYKDTDLLEHPPNGQGVAAILMANILAQFDLPSMDPFGADRAHIEAEAAKLAYDARNRFVADAGHMSRADHLLSLDTARALAALIDPRKAMPDPAAASGHVHRDTIYITVVDRDRMAVSLIYSIFHGFGSGIATERHGILLHNRGAGFCLEPGHPNEAGPGKRPMHTIIPAMLRENGRISMPFGVMGGAYQANGHARVLTNVVDYGMNPQTAIDAPRSFWDQGAMKVERGYSDGVRADLAARGHDVTIPDTPIGGAQAIRIDYETGVLEGGSDPRKDGCALGY
jgi:gamma-glutamyltranspeptidase/glutathione hydrolase